jgi:hypothetical protein
MVKTAAWMLLCCRARQTGRLSCHPEATEWPQAVSLGDHDARVKALLDALRAGDESCRPIPFDNEAFLKRMRARYARSSE